jgi:hypothetical protein
MRELNKADRPSLLELIALFKSTFPEVPCKPENVFIWLANYKIDVVKTGFEITRSWYDRKVAKNDTPKAHDVYRYSTSVMRNVSQARDAMAEIIGDGDGQ